MQITNKFVCGVHAINELNRELSSRKSRTSSYVEFTKITNEIVRGVHANHE